MYHNIGFRLALGLQVWRAHIRFENNGDHTTVFVLGSLGAIVCDDVPPGGFQHEIWLESLCVAPNLIEIRLESAFRGRLFVCSPRRYALTPKDPCKPP